LVTAGKEAAMMHSLLSRFFILACLGSFTLPAISYAQDKAGTARTKTPPHPQLAVSDGLWSGKAVFKSGGAPESATEENREFSFAVKHGALTGDGTIPLHFFCSNGVHLSGSFTVDFGKLMEFSGPNTFRARFPVEQPVVNFNVVVTGTFLSGKSASGTVSVTASKPAGSNGPVMELGPCKAPTIYTWTALPAPQ
jgi:hypothetical protein